MQNIEWKEPALLWNNNVSSPGRPRILQICNDEFLAIFLQKMATADPASFLLEYQIDARYDLDQSLKLYQPIHGCYYLVIASLVCRQVGLPDKIIDRANGESGSFVIRRYSAEGEEAWIPDPLNVARGSWLQVDNDEFLMAGEERFPMHPVKVCAKPDRSYSVFTDNVERVLHFGYISTGRVVSVSDSYVIRTVYEYDSSCPALISALPSQSFTLAGFLEPSPDASTRPSIS